MKKTRNFFLAVLGFFLLSVAFFIFAEVAWIGGDVSTTAISVPATTKIEQAIVTLVGAPQWLISYDKIEIACNHPWVIRRTLPVLDHTIDELVSFGLSECYELVGKQAIYSHLFHQGIGNWSEAPSKFTEQVMKGEKIELFFKHNANFQALNLASPETVSFFGYVVHDLNGDAIFNPDEPVIPEAQICINREPLSPLCVYSNPVGEYRFDDIIPGAWNFRLYSPSKERLTEFKYSNQLIEADHRIMETKINNYTITERYLNLTEFTPIENEILLLVDHEMEHNFFLMQEWATYFAAAKDIDLFHTEAYYDFDVREEHTRIYSGEGNPTYDQHDGLDASCPPGTEIVSVAEGRVIAIFYNSTVAIQHINQLISIYGHGDPLVEENQFVPRGYPVALCNNNLTNSNPHLHFAVWKSTPWLHRISYGIPPYADLVITEEKWVANTHPLDKDYYVYLLQGGRGVWTEINQPHLPYVKLVED